MKITDINEFKAAITKLDKIAQTDSSKILINFNYDENNVSEKFRRFFEVADGENPSWNV